MALFFGRKNKDGEGTEGRMPSSDASKDASLHPALDALAEFVRLFGAHAFDIETERTDTFTARCEAWAKHLLLGAQAPVREELELDDKPPKSRIEPAYADLRTFLGKRRRAEQEFVHSALHELKGALFEVVDNLRGVVSEDAEENNELTVELQELNAALETDSLSELRTRVSKTVRAVSKRLDSRQKRNEKRLSKMGKRLRELRSHLVEARVQSTTDALTGLRNRGALDSAIENYVLLAEISGDPLSMILFDIDHFKALNDQYGHRAGDAVLKAMGDLLVRNFPRKNDFTARYGGEEFVVLLSNADAKDAAKLAERFLVGMRDMTMIHDGQVIATTASAGVACLERRETHASFLERADVALYRAKREGRNRVVVAESTVRGE